MKKTVLLSALLLTLAACGNDDKPPPAPGNAAPVFTSQGAVSITENVANAFYMATATDADGDALSFSISGGPDTARFSISSAGALSFVAPPDFEVPADADGNNIYSVTLSVTDGKASVGLSLNVTVTNDSGSGFTVTRVGTAFALPLFVTGLPDGSGRVLVVEKGGLVRLLDPATGNIAATPFLDVRASVATDGERGLLAIEPAPDFATSGVVYAYLTALDGSIELWRFTANPADHTQVPASSGERLLRIPHPRNNHNGGWLGFGPDGLLYVGTGDGGGANDPDGNGQNTSALLGKMLRLDVSKDDFPADPNRNYGIPADNPFATAGGAPEVWLYGLRNPFRNSFDRMTGTLWIGDVGQDAREEIDRIEPAQFGQTALNLGWPLYEGSLSLVAQDVPGLTTPVLDYLHGSSPFQGNSIIGGYVYRGPVEALQGLYVFADFVSDNIWTVPIGSLPLDDTAIATVVLTNRNADFAPNAGALASITSFGEDEAGNLFIASIGGDIFMVRPTP